MLTSGINQRKKNVKRLLKSFEARNDCFFFTFRRHPKELNAKFCFVLSRAMQIVNFRWRFLLVDFISYRPHSWSCACAKWVSAINKQTNPFRFWYYRKLLAIKIEISFDWINRVAVVCVWGWKSAVESNEIWMRVWNVVVEALNRMN